MSTFSSFLAKLSARPDIILRIAVAGEFFGHGVFALQGKEGWFKYFAPFGFTDEQTIVNLLFIIGFMDVLLAIHVLTRPIRPLILWMAFWGMWTALIRWPIGPDPIWDFFERWANWGAPLALFLLLEASKKTTKRLSDTGA